MNYIKKLYEIQQKPHRLIIGLMSGTSLDGLDVALCRFGGSGATTQVELLAFETLPYNQTVHQQVRQVFSQKSVDLELLTLLHPWIATLHADMVRTCLKKWQKHAADIDLIASHGQTIYHAPKRLHQRPGLPNATLQIGDGDHLAVQTGIITISDFRQKHIAAGGEGAPLAVYGDYLLFSGPGEDRIMLNIGGIANFTYLSGDGDVGRMFSTDVGPGNTLIDRYTRTYFQQPYDQNGAIAASGTVHEPLLKALLNHSFFTEAFPKTTGPELFGTDYVAQAQKMAEAQNLSPQDLIATLTCFSAMAIADAVQQIGFLYAPVIYASGGGMHNPVLMSHIRNRLPDMTFKTTDDLHILPDAKEAVLFAVLANETVAGGQGILASRPGLPVVTMGKISFPG